MKKLFLVTPLLIWIALGYTDVISYFFQHPKPMFFRGWEYVVNEGKDSLHVPFKPQAYYLGKMTGDQLNYLQFLPKPSDIRTQEFQVDEYGFRNPVGMLKKPIFAVMTGTSFVGGAQETQSNLITTMLSNKYKIPTYNYATLPLQFLWEDTRFIVNKPKYVIVVGNESEIMLNGWIEVLKDSPIKRTLIPYQSYNQWDQINNKPAITYSYISRETKRFSIVRYLSKVMKVKILNTVLPRSIIFAISNAEHVEYDKTRDILFYDKIVINPKLSKENLNNIEQAIKTLTTTKEVLASRDIKLLVVPVPSKVHMHSEEFMNLPDSMFALPFLEKEMDKNNIDFVDVYQPMKEFLKKNPNELLYFPDDGHWNTITNQIIAQKIADKLQK